MNYKKQSVVPVLIPLIVAVFVVAGLAVSGYITKNADQQSPTAQTSVSAVNADAETQTSDSEQDSKVTMVAVGDNLIHNTLIAAGEQEDGSLNYSSFYAQIQSDIQAADVAIINQETMLGGSSFDYAGYPCFNTPWEVGEAAISAGFDIFTCATNHAMDVGSAGIEKELEFFDDHPEVVHIGTNASEEAYHTITYYKKNNITFALLNYTYGTNGISLPDDKPWIVNLMDRDKITSDIKEARENADVVIVFPHWGTENSHEISEYQEEYVNLFSSLGVDIVIGTHPHVLQKVEWVSNEETGKKMLVYYSLGNFISHQTNLNQLVGGMAEITIEKKDQQIEITAAKLAPVVCHYKNTSSGYSFTVYKISDYTEELADSHSQSGLTVTYCTELAQEIISEEFLDLS